MEINDNFSIFHKSSEDPSHTIAYSVSHKRTDARLRNMDKSKQASVWLIYIVSNVQKCPVDKGRRAGVQGGQGEIDKWQL